MIKFDNLLFSVLFGITIPLLCFISSWWGTFIFTDDQKIIIIASLSGLSVGILISVLLKLVYKPDIYGLSRTVLVLVYLFYNMVLFSMFMGVPFFHLFLGIVAGYYQAKYMIYHNKVENYKTEIRRIPAFTATVFGVVCLLSATIALTNKSTASELQSMFHLPFEISQPILIVSVIAGGLIMIVVQYLLVKVTMKETLSGNF
jgi:hypothetical protein